MLGNCAVCGANSLPRIRERNPAGWCVGVFLRNETEISVGARPRSEAQDISTGCASGAVSAFSASAPRKFCSRRCTDDSSTCTCGAEAKAADASGPAMRQRPGAERRSARSPTAERAWVPNFSQSQIDCLRCPICNLSTIAGSKPQTALPAHVEQVVLRVSVT